MAWDLATAKARLNLTDPVDPVVEQQITDTMTMVEDQLARYLNREFLYADAVETFIRPQGYGISVSRYPITNLKSVTVNGSSSITQHVDAHVSIGILRSGSFHRAMEVAVDMEAGYQPNALPTDLEWAMWQVFDRFYGEVTGAMPGAGDSGNSAIRSMTIFDVGTVAYDTGAEPSESGTPLDIMNPSSRLKDTLQAYTRDVGAL